MTRSAAVSQATIQRAVRALVAVGETVSGVELLAGGDVRVLIGPQIHAVANPESVGAGWDKFLSPAA